MNESELTDRELEVKAIIRDVKEGLIRFLKALSAATLAISLTLSGFGDDDDEDEDDDGG